MRSTRFHVAYQRWVAACQALVMCHELRERVDARRIAWFARVAERLRDMQALAMGAVLVVEDDDDIREVVAECFTQAGVEVATACNGEEALRFIRSSGQPPCLVLLDLMMPTMDGYQVMAVLREESRVPALAVIVMTATPGAQVPGARDRLRKPVTLDHLLALARHYCGGLAARS